jgi:predicted dehydrogenase
MPAPIRWGILGAGHIARSFAQGLQALPDATLAGVASRTEATARDFARQVSVQRVYTSYEELVNDPSINVIYVATPHHRHMEDCLLCIEHGKAVLCEKPFTINANDARRVVTAARKRRVFCMEAMWMRFLPAVRRARDLVASGSIGEPRMLTADFGVATAFDAKNRFYDPAKGGGALLDRGVYPISLAVMLFGMPEQIVSQAGISPTGVDEHSALLMRFSGGRLAVLSSSLSTYTTNEAAVMGTRGKLRIHAPFYCSEQLTLSRYTPGTVTSASAPGLKQRVMGRLRQNALMRRTYQSLKPLLSRGEHRERLRVEGNGYNYEAAEVMRCLRAGELESKLMPLDETIAIMAIMDEVRSAWGLRYPGE